MDIKLLNKAAAGVIPGLGEQGWHFIAHVEKRTDTEIVCPICEILFLIIGTEFENGNRTWLYFGFRGGPVASDDESLPTLRFTVMNMNKQSKLFRSENILLYVHTIFFMNTNKQVKKPFHLYGKLLVDSFYLHTYSGISQKQRILETPFV